MAKKKEPVEKRVDNIVKVDKWPIVNLHGAKRANIRAASLPDWFVGYGKDEGCTFEGSWWDMICFARNILASENTRLAAPEFHHPEMQNDNYTGPKPYEFTGNDQEDESTDPTTKAMLEDIMTEHILGQLAFQQTGRKRWFERVQEQEKKGKKQP